MEDVGYRNIFTILGDAHILVIGFVILCLFGELLLFIEDPANITMVVIGIVVAWLSVVWCDQISRRTGGSTSWAVVYGVFGLIEVFLYWLARKIQTGK
jgi:hypothetical protein